LSLPQPPMVAVHGRKSLTTEDAFSPYRRLCYFSFVANGNHVLVAYRDTLQMSYSASSLRDADVWFRIICQ